MQFIRDIFAAQQAGFQPVPETSVQVSQPAAEPSVQKPKGSRLVIILGILCLLTALFAPVVNKQSVMGMLLAKLPKNISISLPKTQKIKPQTPGFEEASRALFAGDQAGLDARIADWPVDVQAHLRRVLADAFFWA